MSRTDAGDAESGVRASAALMRGGAAGDLLTFGFGAAVAMWFVGYLTHMPGVAGLAASGAATAGLLGACVVGAGVVMGRMTGRGWSGGAQAGAITGVINLLIIGSLLSGEGGKAAREKAMYWVPAMLGATAGMMAMGAVMGGMIRRWHDTHAERPARGPSLNAGRGAALNGRDWTGAFAKVAFCATGVLILSGGLVTAHEAGLAVKDWPTSFGHNMWLYPLAKMTGNVYYEHTHRLYGTLVGLTTLMLMVHLLMADRRGWVKAAAVGAFVMVCVQGVMGGLRVTAAMTPGTGVEVATAAHETAASAVLRVSHGVFAQVFFAWMGGLAVFTSKGWMRVTGPRADASGSMERTFSIGLVGLLLVQLVLGARVRHLQDPVAVHLIGAAVVVIAAFSVGMRVWGLHGEAHPPLKRLGAALVALVTVQLVLGFGAYFAKGMAAAGAEGAGDGAPTMVDVVVTTAHQFTGALLLATATAVCLMVHRRLGPMTNGNGGDMKRGGGGGESTGRSASAGPEARVAMGDLPEEEVRRVMVGDEPVAVVRVGGVVYAVSDNCTHANIPLSDGCIIDGKLVCPWHGAMFDLTTGAPTCGPASHPLRCYAVTVEGDGVVVRRREV